MGQAGGQISCVLPFKTCFTTLTKKCLKSKKERQMRECMTLYIQMYKYDDQVCHPVFVPLFRHYQRNQKMNTFPKSRIDGRIGALYCTDAPDNVASECISKVIVNFNG